MRVAVHHRPRSYSDRWLIYLAERGIPHRIVDGFSDRIVTDVAGCDLFLWHWDVSEPAGLLRARAILDGLAVSGVRAYPDYATSYHYDNKIAQKYLLESAGAPLVATHVFYDAAAANVWIATADFPLVFKLSRGAGSSNVSLVANPERARALIRTMFGRGICPVPGVTHDLVSKNRGIRSVAALAGKVQRAPATLRAIAERRRGISRERGYVYFQDYLPNNDHDTRIVIVGDRAVGLTRYNRPGDFRASGSGRLDYDASHIDPRLVAIAFAVSARLGFQTMAYDFLRDADGNPRICEISYCVSGKAYAQCEGSWDRDLNFHVDRRPIEDRILDALLP